MSNQDMLQAKSLFRSEKGSNSVPDYLDFGDVAGMYRKDKNLTSDRTLIAQASDQPSFIKPAQQMVDGEKIADRARELGESQPKRWQNDEKHNIYTCNKFLDASLRESGVKLPWETEHIPTVHNMRAQLGRDADFKQVYSSGSKFEQYKGQAGDVVMWDTIPYHYPTEQPHRFEHSGIIDVDGTLMYGGSTQTRGYAETPLKTLVSVYGPPTAIYRYNPQHH